MHDTLRRERTTQTLQRVCDDEAVVYETITLCQPDRRKSCTACCGLFNYMDISRERLQAFLSNGAARSSACVAENDQVDRGDNEEVRDRTSYICPHQGLLYNLRPGCLLHPLYRNTTLRNAAFFGEAICDGFTCPSHAMLSPEEKRILVDLLDDWYRYTVAIIDPSSTSWLLSLLKHEYSSAYHHAETLKSILDECLMIHASHLGRRRGPIFFYSVAEYEACKTEFSLACSGTTSTEVSEIIAAVKRFL